MEKHESEDEDEDCFLPAKSFDVEVRLYGDNSEEKTSEIFVQIMKKSGDIVEFNKFYKSLMEDGELSMFVEPNELELVSHADSSKWEFIRLS